MTNAVVALGANLGSPRQQIIDALRAIKSQPEFSLLDVSSIYSSPPMGPPDQPDYMNAVCIISSNIGAADTLATLHNIEDSFGRTRTRHWGERTLDLDLILFGDQRSDADSLRLPHPGLYQRNFVLLPLAEIAADLTLPNGDSAQQQAQRVTEEGLTVVLLRDKLKQQLG
ncbi:MAG: 2-amino-4-hydroxy-6-hydroxymethyldihydropteridine diphosphokinase [Idiomarina sp.]|uniref:2-amino-4-hydroxy-6-hydroxymethyldihydropteridine pyrophosphokinase n=1 Tax=Idiomarina aquatica TaxID=1327752 RepID=A0A4V3CN48_9GAMM|nr:MULTISPECIES: 2-amino-4-hydroxy-6-hydroxymethyldihydropteridine diphosphokinase [Idiomarina]MAK72138.1 2-amino-4-hydroxy-6-hydroxymethyldihydropteridine diphosphokinase [Idiomarinaceae bacterium]MBL4742648.1 2-amino-4-hydroxy-6-hydroxymethyldihydropteridine diphosphokinase [Idiomarina sp.]MBT43168.1 2-amino-4-hydroxy-6-hydroxymethyldihydropteridine diphosphokinase [Idiomarina sp.]PHQ75438.1 MAG: 2-amino-4-hydroxy-6-hydroxymethyldihydropteridine diphosphokinase [Idiomarina sp.]TDP32592.1 2-a